MIDNLKNFYSNVALILSDVYLHFAKALADRLHSFEFYIDQKNGVNFTLTPF